MSRSDNNQTAASEKSWPRMGLISRENGGCALVDISRLHLWISITGLIATLSKILKEYWSKFRAQVSDGNRANYKKLICFTHKISYPPTQPTLWLPRTRIDSLCKTSRKVVRGQICGGRKEKVPTRAAGGGKREEEMTGKLATPRKCPQAHPSPKSQNRTAEILWIQANCPTFIATKMRSQNRMLLSLRIYGKNICLKIHNKNPP